MKRHMDRDDLFPGRRSALYWTKVLQLSSSCAPSAPPTPAATRVLLQIIHNYYCDKSGFSAEYCVTVRGVWVKHSDCQCGSNRLRMLQLQKMTVTACQLCSVSFVALTEIHAETCKCDVSQNTV